VAIGDGASVLSTIASAATSVTTLVTSNDSDPEGAAIFVASVSNATHGVATVLDASTIKFEPAVNYVGDGAFTYTLQDGAGGTAQATVTIAIQNRLPTATDDTISMGTVGGDKVIDPRSNDTDPEQQTLTVISVTQPPAGQGSAAVSGSGATVTYTPPVGFWGVTNFSYTVRDPANGEATAQVSINNDPPVSQPDADSLWSNVSGASSSKAISVLANDTDAESGALTVTGIQEVANGTAAINGSQQVVFTPTLNFVGAASFKYRASDPHGASSALTPVTVTVNNRTPSAASDAVTTLSNSAVTLDPRTNDSDPEGTQVTITSATGTNGAATINNGASVTFVPASNFVGAASYSYTITDAHGGTASAIVSVTVNNRAPVANTDNVSTPSNAALTTSVMGNDSDPEGGVLTLVSAQAATNGSVSVSGSSVTFTPNVNFVGTGSYTYTIRDPFDATATATVYVTVQNRAPSAVADATSTLKNTAVTFNPRGNDTDPEGQALTVISASSASNGAASVGGGGTTVTFTPNTNFTGTGSFAYTIQDTYGATSTANVTVDVTPPPVAINNPGIAFASHETATIQLSTLAAISGSASILSFSPPQGTASIAGDGQSVSYTAPFNNVSYCDAQQGGASPLVFSIPYVIRHSTAGDHNGTVAMTVNYNVVGGPPKGGCQ
jgi:large repetitive protein